MKADLQHTINNSQEKPADIIEIMEFTYIVAEMLSENMAFVQERGLTEKAKISRQRLIKLLKAAEHYNSLTTKMNTLVLINNDLLSENQRVKSELNQLKREISIANSI